MGRYLTMKPDENAQDAARKETQEFDPAVADEEVVDSIAAQNAELIVLEQEQPDKEAEEKPGNSGNWHQFKTP
jgi:hypothetical protein